MNSAKSSATTMLAVLTMRWIVSGKRASGTTRKTRPFYKNTFAHHTNMSEKRKIVLDTNCLIASLSRRGQYFHLIEEDHDDDKFVDCAFAAMPPSLFRTISITMSCKTLTSRSYWY